MKLITIYLILFCSIYKYSAGQSYHVKEYDVAGAGYYDNMTSLFAYKNEIYFYVQDTQSHVTFCKIDSTGHIIELRKSNDTSKILTGKNYNVFTDGNKLYFSFSTNMVKYGKADYERFELWSYDGLTTTLKKDFTLSSKILPSGFHYHDGSFYFYCFDTATGDYEIDEYNLYSDQLKTLVKVAPFYNLSPRESTHFQNRLYYISEGTQLFKPQVLYTYDPNMKISWPIVNYSYVNNNEVQHTSNLYEYNNTLYFVGSSQSNRDAVYAYDGANPPLRLTNHPSYPSNLKFLGAHNGYLYYSYYYGAGKKQYLFQLDPSTNSTRLMDSAINNFSYQYAALYNNKLFFSNNGNTSVVNLWYIDKIGSLNTIKDFITPENLTTSESYLYFTAISDNQRKIFRYEDWPLSLHDINTSNIATIYPNPAKDIAHLEIDLKQNETLEILLTDMQGRTVYKSNKVLYSAAKHTIDIPLHNLPAGNFMYSLYSSINGSLVASGKLVKE